LLAAARRQAETEAFQRTYTQWRPMVERSLAWLVRNGNRRVAYRGIERNRMWLSHRVAAVDLRRPLNLGLNRSPDGWAAA
jgi:Transposase DDE domain